MTKTMPLVLPCEREIGPKADDSGRTLGGKSSQATENVLTKFPTSVAPRIRNRTRTVGSGLPFSCFPLQCLILTSKVLTDNH